MHTRTQEHMLVVSRVCSMIRWVDRAGMHRMHAQRAGPRAGHAFVL